MLLTDYSLNESWYVSYVDEILSGIQLDEIELDESKLIEETSDTILKFCFEFSRCVQNKLLETNEEKDIQIYLLSLRIASYNVNLILSGIYSRSKDFFIKRPVLHLLIFTNTNMFQYKELRLIYDDWQNEN